MEFLASLAIKALIGTSVCGTITVGTIYKCDKTLLGFKDNTQTTPKVTQGGKSDASNPITDQAQQLTVVGSDKTGQTNVENGKATGVNGLLGDDSNQQQEVSGEQNQLNGQIKQQNGDENPTPEVSKSNESQGLVNGQVTDINAETSTTGDIVLNDGNTPTQVELTNSGSNAEDSTENVLTSKPAIVQSTLLTAGDTAIKVVTPSTDASGDKLTLGTVT